MKSTWKIATAVIVVMHTSLIANAQTEAPDRHIINRLDTAQDANLWITGLGKFNNGLMLRKNGSEAALLGIQLTDLTQTKGVNFQLTTGTNPGLATWIHDGTNWVERLRINSTGYVGINAQTPGKRLDILDSSSIVYTATGAQAIPYGGIVQINNTSKVDGSAALFLMTADNTNGIKNAAYMGITSNGSGAYSPEFVFGQRRSGFLWGEAMRITGNGSLAIGTTKVPNGYKLAVEGAILARRVKVDQQTWADYVFEPEYKLPSLQEVEAFIKEHKHLPDVPSAKEIASEKLDLGEMNKILLQKIEELTLHLIELKKENAAQQAQINQLINK